MRFALRRPALRQRAKRKQPILLDPIEPVGGHAARIMADALWIEELAPAEMAEACRRPAEWIEGVVDGSVDPTLDELELAVNAIGLETRISLGGVYGRKDLPTHDRQELADRISRYRAMDMEEYGQVWIQREPPQPGVTARQFSAGPGRTDGGGKAAVLIAFAAGGLQLSASEFASRTGLSDEDVTALTLGKRRPTYSEVERILAAVGIPMAVMLEEYEWHDDELHNIWKADPTKYEEDLAALGEEVLSLEGRAEANGRIRAAR